MTPDARVLAIGYAICIEASPTRIEPEIVALMARRGLTTASPGAKVERSFTIDADRARTSWAAVRDDWDTFSFAADDDPLGFGGDGGAFALHLSSTLDRPAVFFCLFVDRAAAHLVVAGELVDTIEEVQAIGTPRLRGNPAAWAERLGDAVRRQDVERAMRSPSEDMYGDPCTIFDPFELARILGIEGTLLERPDPMPPATSPRGLVANLLGAVQTRSRFMDPDEARASRQRTAAALGALGVSPAAPDSGSRQRVLDFQQVRPSD